MKSKLLLGLCALTITHLTSAQVNPGRGKWDSKGGGGGDASEARVNEIRTDILKWIEDGGAAGLNFSGGLRLNQYVSAMTEILQPQKVVVTFVEDDLSPDEELRVIVDGKPKTCRGFYSRDDANPHIVCHISRFRGATDAEQYRLIHHEYAGLVLVEKNEGPSSDYLISNQLTTFLEPVVVNRLVVKTGLAKSQRAQAVNSCSSKSMIPHVRDGIIGVLNTLQGLSGHAFQSIGFIPSSVSVKKSGSGYKASFKTLAGTKFDVVMIKSGYTDRSLFSWRGGDYFQKEFRTLPFKSPEVAYVKNAEGVVTETLCRTYLKLDYKDWAIALVNSANGNYLVDSVDADLFYNLGSGGRTGSGEIGRFLTIDATLRK